jgi:tRNA (adenine57-N1/adenine58-N1)-methyltransferase
MDLKSEIADGELLYIIHDRRRKWLRKVIADQEFHTDKGIIRYNEIIGKAYGEMHILPPQGNKVALLKPTPSDIVINMRRESQIIYPEDIGLILVYAGIQPGMQILEAGVGSATVTSIMAMFVGPTGHVDSFDVRDVAIKQGIKNLTLMGVMNQCSVRFGDICKDDLDIPLKDFIMLDLPSPWLAIPRMKKYLKPEGRICSFSPVIEQVRKVDNVFKESGFHNIIHLELVKRTWQVKPNASRPNTPMIGHTGYLTFATNDITPLPVTSYNTVYCPENIGFLLVYAGILPGKKVLIVTEKGLQLQTILSSFLSVSENSDMIMTKTSKDLDQQQIDGSAVYDVVFIDNCPTFSLDRIIENIKLSGLVCGLFQTIEGSKTLINQMVKKQFFDISTYELITRQIFIPKTITEIESTVLPHSGYITLGRKVFDPYPAEPPKKVTDEKVEVLIDTGLEFGDELERQGKTEKIDYANLTEEEQEMMDREYLDNNKN